MPLSPVPLLHSHPFGGFGVSEGPGSPDAPPNEEKSLAEPGLTAGEDGGAEKSAGDNKVGPVDLLVNEDDDEQAESESESDDDVDDGLMDIFTSEEEEDVDLSSLTDSLTDVEIGSLLAEARDVLAGLRKQASAA